MNLLDKAKLNISYRELKDLDIDDKLLSEILSNKDFLSEYKKYIREFVLEIKNNMVDKDFVKFHLMAIYELAKTNNASKYIDFIKRNSLENRKLNNINVFKDKNFEYLYSLIGVDIFSDKVSEVIDKGFSDRLVDYVKNNSSVDLSKLDFKFFEDKVWSVISANPNIGDKTIFELFGRRMDILLEVIQNGYFEGLVYTYENIPESRNFIEHQLGYINSASLEQFSMDFIQNIGIKTLSELYKKSCFSESQEFEKIFKIYSYGNYELIKDIINYDKDARFIVISQEEMNKSLIESSIGNYNKSELVLNKYFDIERKDIYYLPLFLEAINKANLSFEYKEKYGTVLELLNKLYSVSDEEIISIAQSLDRDRLHDYSNLLSEMEREGNELIKQQFSKDLLEKTSQIEDISKHSVVASPSGKNIDVYTLEGQPFTMLVHCVISNPLSSNNDIAEKIIENPKLWNEINKGNNFISTSLISDKSMVTYGWSNRGDSINFGFDNVPAENVKYVNIGDAGTKRRLDSDTEFNMRDSLSARINTVDTIDDIISKTEEANKRMSGGYGIYNEIVLSRTNANEEKLMPAYIVCFDRIYDKDIKAAEDFNIPIYLIDRKYYYSYVQYMRDIRGIDISVDFDDNFSRKLKAS